MRIKMVTELTAERLRSQGIRALMVDLDDTLVASNSERMGLAFRRWVLGLKEAGIAVMFLSNGKPKRVARWAQLLGVEGLSLSGKPFRFAFERGLKRLGTLPGETAMVGDQLFTDVLGANALGIKTILVTPLSNKGLPHTRLARKIERLVLKTSASNLEGGK
jgi:HAD superfamily phosphatase (TIGR01668 family)